MTARTCSLLTGLAIVISAEAANAQFEDKEIVGTSSSGAWRLEFSQPEADVLTQDPDALGDVWLVSTKDPTQRAKLPKQSAGSPYDDEFHFSPNEEWLFGSRHVGSGLRYANLYHRLTPLKINMPTKDESFNDVAWENCAKLRALKENYSAEGVYAITSFVGWSLDSSRILIELKGGEEKRSMQSGFLYFNTRTNKFELTDYVRKLNKAKSELLACAEPVGPLPSEAELKARFDALDKKLNQKYGEVVAQAEKDQAPNIRANERAWIKHRDAGARFYLSLFPQAERERRRLQFLDDVTAARIEAPTGDWYY